jgi:hypothetical protein
VAILRPGFDGMYLLVPLNRCVDLDEHSHGTKRDVCSSLWNAVTFYCITLPNLETHG